MSIIVTKGGGYGI